jgi:hypothetical protein
MTGSITASFHDLALGRAREKSLKNFGLVPLRWRRSDCVELDPSPLCCGHANGASWSGWGTLTSVTGSEADPTPSASNRRWRGLNYQQFLLTSD